MVIEKKKKNDIKVLKIRWIGLVIIAYIGLLIMVFWDQLLNY
jgi:preprotein translocase subunit Sss1